MIKLRLSLILGAGMLLLCMCGVSEKQRVERLIESGRLAVIRHDLDQVMSVVDESYRDAFGMDYDRLEGWFERNFGLYDSIVCRTSALRIHVNGSAATCSLTFYSAGLRTERPDLDADGFPVYQGKMVLELRKFADDWRIVRSR